MHKPDYNGGSIVNLMATLITARGGAATLYPPLESLDTAALARCKNLILLVIDGLGYRYLLEQGSRTTLAQHLRGSMTSVFPSTTATAITTFLTGLAPQQHGLTGWFSYLKELDTIAAVLPFQNRMTGTSLAETGITPDSLFAYEPVFDRLATRSYVVVPARIAHSPYNSAHTGRAHMRPYETLRQFFEVIASVIREHDAPKYVYAYWPELDHIGHERGIASRSVTTHFKQLDGSFGRFLGGLAGTDSTVIVTGDHGMIDSALSQQITLDDHPRLAEMLCRPLCGERRAAYCYVDPGNWSQFESYVRDQLADRAVLKPSSEVLNEGWFGLGDPHPRLRDRIGDYTLLMQAHYTIKDWLPGERRYVHIGTHGGVSENEMLVPLIVAEP